MKKIIYTSAIAALALLAVACGQSKDDKEQGSAAAPKEEKPQVKLQQVFVQTVSQNETYTGTIESNLKNNIAPNTPYRIKKIYYDVGDYVRKGAVVVDLDKSNLTQGNIQIENQRLAIENARLQMENQKVEFNRMAELYSIGGVSKSEYDSAKLLYDQTVIAYNNAQKQLNLIQTQNSQLAENARLTAPMSGYVTARNYDDGDMYTSQPIITIEQTNPVKLMINVSEIYYERVKPGMEVDVTLDAYQDRLFRGTVATVYPTIDQATHTFPVEIYMANDQQQIRPGMYARVKMSMGDVTRVMVPDIAIVKQIGAGDRYVYVYNDGKVSYNRVELGEHVGNMFEVASGVNDGDMVVVAGMSKLANGREVQVVTDDIAE